MSQKGEEVPKIDVVSTTSGWLNRGSEGNSQAERRGPDGPNRTGLRRRPLLQWLHRHPAGAPAIVLAVSVLVFELLNQRFLRAEDISLMLQQLAVLGCLAIGQTIIMLTAGIDLSVGAVMILTQMVMAELAVTVGLPASVALLIGVLCGVAAGAVNGGLAAQFGLPPFIVTLGTLGVYTAMGLWLSGGTTIFFSNSRNLLLWTGNVISIGPFNITTGVLLMIGLYLLVAYMLGRTAWGRHVYAVGGSPEASQLSGIRVRSLLLSVYVMAGILYGIGGWIQIGRVGNASTNISSTLNLDSITAVVIGGTSLFGGRGVVIGTLVGAMIVQVFQTGLALAGVQSIYLQFAEGLLVIGAVTVDHWVRAVTTGEGAR
jgi:fructose transport system permease protein